MVSGTRQWRTTTPAWLLTFSMVGCGGAPPAPTPLPPVIMGPRTTFGPGTWTIGTDIAPGRYYADPLPGCVFTRFLTLSRPPLEGPPWNGYTFSFDPGQWIVDIVDTDREFVTNAACGTWVPTPVKGLQATPSPGIWLVGAQIAPGVYATNVTQGCHWERLSHFDRTGLAGILAGDIILENRPFSVEIRDTDAGFLSTPPCGPWRRVP